MTTTITIVLSVIAGVAFFSAAIALLCRFAPVEYYDDGEIERINRIIAASKHHREQLEARAEEFVRIHGYEWGSCEADDLARVVWDGEDYAESMQRIMRRKLQRQAK